MKLETCDEIHTVNFQDFVHKLSVLSRGSLDEKLKWAFSLYDINGDGCITREEMTDIVTAIYELMGKLAEPCFDEETIKDKVDRIFQVRLDRRGPAETTLVSILNVIKSV